jgi:hypothetical protein
MVRGSQVATAGRSLGQLCLPIEAGYCTYGLLGFGSPVSRDAWL